MVSVSQLRTPHIPDPGPSPLSMTQLPAPPSLMVTYFHPVYILHNPSKSHDNLIRHCLSFHPCSEAAILSPPVPPPPAPPLNLVSGLLLGGIFVAFFGPNQDTLSLQNPFSQSATTQRTLKTCYIQTAIFRALLTFLVRPEYSLKQ